MGGKRFSVCEEVKGLVLCLPRPGFSTKSGFPLPDGVRVLIGQNVIREVGTFHLYRFRLARSAAVPEDIEPTPVSLGQVFRVFLQARTFPLVSNTVLSRQMQCNVTAIFLAVATAAFLNPFRS